MTTSLSKREREALFWLIYAYDSSEPGKLDIPRDPIEIKSALSSVLKKIQVETLFASES